MKKLPIGLQNLREMRTQGYAYVDKTPFVAQLAEQGKYYFLARPRHWFSLIPHKKFYISVYYRKTLHDFIRH